MEKRGSFRTSHGDTLELAFICVIFYTYHAAAVSEERLKVDDLPPP